MNKFSTHGLAAAIALALTACNSGNGDGRVTELRCETATTVNPQLNEEFNMRVGAIVTLNGADKPLELQFVAKESDSRCPTDVECIQAGSAVLSMVGQVGSDEPKAFTLETDTDTRESLDFQSGPFSGAYFVELRSVAPAPISTREIPDDGYCATFVVTQIVE